MNLIPLHRESRVAVYGLSEFSELVYLGLKEIGVEEIDFYRLLDEDSAGSEGQKFLGTPVCSIDSFNQVNYDRIVIGSPQDSKKLRKELKNAGVDPDIIFGFFEGGQ